MKRFFLVVVCALAAFTETGSWQAAADDIWATGDKDKEPVAGTEAYLRRALTKPVSIDVTDKPLDEVVKALAKQVNVTVMFRHGALDAVGLDASALRKVSLTLYDLPLRSCLRVILPESELTYMVDEGVLVITTPEDAESHEVTGVLDVSDLLDVEEASSFGEGQADYDSLIDLVTTSVAPTSWSEQTGPGPVRGFRGTIVVRQTNEVIDQIRQLLSAIREAKQIVAKHGHSQPPVTSVAAAQPRDAVTRLRKALNSQADFEFKDTPLDEVIAHLRKQYRVPMRISESALDAVGLGPKTKVTCSARSGTLRSALRRCLNELDLTYILYEGVFTITTPEDAEQNLSLRVYPVQDLVEPIPWDSQLWWGVGSNRSEEVFEYDSLMNLTTLNVVPTSWDEVGGPGSAHPLEAYGLIVVAQTEENHWQLETLYGKLRKTIPAAAKKPIKKPADDELRLAVYSVPRNFPEFSEEPSINPSEREVLGLITSIIEPESWRDRDDVYAHAIKDRLIIRHTNAVHRQIYQLATKLEIMGFRELGVDGRVSRPFIADVVPVVSDKQLPKSVRNDPVRR